MQKTEQLLCPRTELDGIFSILRDHYNSAVYDYCHSYNLTPGMTCDLRIPIYHNYRTSRTVHYGRPHLRVRYTLPTGEHRFTQWGTSFQVSEPGRPEPESSSMSEEQARIASATRSMKDLNDYVHRLVPWLGFRSDIFGLEVRGILSKNCFVDEAGREITDHIVDERFITWISVLPSSGGGPAGADVEADVDSWMHQVL